MKKTSHVLTTESAIEIATEMLGVGAAPFVVAHALANDGFSAKQTETIMRWAYMKLANKITKA